MRIEPLDVTTPDAAALLSAYFADIVSRIHGRAATEAEVAEVMADETSDRLVEPFGCFLAAWGRDGDALGCIGLRALGDDVGEVKRMYVVPAARGLGLGSALLEAGEKAALRRGWTRLRLDTRTELIEARGLYENRGYVPITAYNDNVYAHHWYEKVLAKPQAGTQS